MPEKRDIKIRLAADEAQWLSEALFVLSCKRRRSNKYSFLKGKANSKRGRFWYLYFTLVSEWGKATMPKGERLCFCEAMKRSVKRIKCQTQSNGVA